MKNWNLIFGLCLIWLTLIKCDSTESNDSSSSDSDSGSSEHIHHKSQNPHLGHGHGNNPAHAVPTQPTPFYSAPPPYPCGGCVSYYQAPPIYAYQQPAMGYPLAYGPYQQPPMGCLQPGGPYQQSSTAGFYQQPPSVDTYRQPPPVPPNSPQPPNDLDFYSLYPSQPIDTSRTKSTKRIAIIFGSTAP